MSLTTSNSLVLSTVVDKTVGQAAVSANVGTVIKNTFATATGVYTVEGGLGSTAVDYDLKGGLENPLGDVLTLSTLLMLYIKNLSANVLSLGGANNVPLFSNISDKILIPAGGVLYLAGSYAVTAITGDLLTIQSNTTAGAYSAGTGYMTGDQVTVSGTAKYISLAGDATTPNTGNTPASSPLWWALYNDEFDMTLLGIV